MYKTPTPSLPRVPDPSYTKQVLTDQQSNPEVGSWSIEELHETLLNQWGGSQDISIGHEEIKLTLGLDKYRSWLMYFIENNLPYGAVSAWMNAAITTPALFFGHGNNPQWRLEPGQFGRFCELAEGSSSLLEPENDRDGSIILRDDINYARRVWDVRANKVIPSYWVPQAMIEPVSHAWVAPEKLDYIWSPINYYQWSIPIPRGSTLEAVRQELLRFGVVYSWLDVVCLRQKMTESAQQRDIPIDLDRASLETQRLKEWTIDVPLIGGIYMFGGGRVFVYLNGLGNPYDGRNQDSSNKRHWLRRAWTLQETVEPEKMIIAGLPEGTPQPLASHSHDHGQATSCAIAKVRNHPS